MNTQKTQVGIVGAGPSGLMLSRLLHNIGVANVVIDIKSREYIESRVRAGMLEQGTVAALKEAGVSEGIDKNGLPHDGFILSFDGHSHRIDTKKLTGKHNTVYGQTEVTKDLMKNLVDNGLSPVFSAESVALEDVTSATPKILYVKDGQQHTLQCEFIAGCDGFHGVSRQSIPSTVLKTFERVYPFGWLGILCEAPPVSHELIYANHADGFALCTMRSETRSRYYVQCDANDSIDNWPDDRFYDELVNRIGEDASEGLVRGASFEKSIAPLRSFVAEPMRYGNLFLAGDSAHIVPPTGAKGLNLAIGDVRILKHALTAHYKHNNSSYLDNYSETCLKRVWKVERFSWYMSMMLHQFPEHSEFDKKMQRAEFDYICNSEIASASVAENYVGLSLELDEL